MGRADIYPFAGVGTYSGERYPDWIRALHDRNGVYVIRERGSGVIAYVGESHSSRLYGTLTRHFQTWSPKYDTAGPTYDRANVEVAVVTVPKTHAMYLQNDLICALDPRDNRLVCGEIYETEGLDHGGVDDPVVESPPRGYDYDVSRIIDALFHEFDSDDEIPF